MKKMIFFAMLGATCVFSACKKDNTNDGMNTGTGNTIRYDFTASIPADYNLKAQAGATTVAEAITGNTWSKTLTDQTQTVNAANLTVYPPTAWVGTSTTANVSLKISVNNILKASMDTVLAGLDHSAGITLSTAY